MVKRILCISAIVWLSLLMVAGAAPADNRPASAMSQSSTSQSLAVSAFSAASAKCEDPAARRSTAGEITLVTRLKTGPAYRLMDIRYKELCLTLVGYDASGQSLVALRNGHFIASNNCDDQGIVWLIPALIRTFHLTLDEGIDLFFDIALALSLILCLLGFFLLFPDTVNRLIAVVGLGALFLGTWIAGDVSMFYVIPAVAVVPLFLWFTRKTIPSIRFAVFLFSSGAFIGISDIVRSHSGTAALIFLVFVLLASQRLALKWRIILCAVLLAGMAIPRLAYDHAFAQRNEFLSRREPETAAPQKGHVLWHSVYIGLGFVQNPYVPAYEDGVGFRKAHSIDPTVVDCSPGYEKILRGEVFRLVRTHPQFIVTNLAAKGGIVLLYLLICANIGLVAAFLYPKGWVVESAFWLAIGFDSLFGVLIAPEFPYLLGLTAFGVMYGILSINHAVEEGALHRLRTSSRHTRQGVAP